MKSLFKKQIVDERMELQSLKNTKKSWNFILLASGLCILIEMYVFHWNFKYVAPQWLVLMFSAFYNLFLDVRDGNVYVQEASNRKNVFLLYTISALIAALITGYGLYSTTGKVLYGVAAAAGCFLVILIMIYLLDTFCTRMARRRMEKLEEASEE